MHALLKLRLASRRNLRDRIEWRHGFLAAIDRRTFSNLPPAMTDAEVTDNSKDSKPFAEGFKHGMTCALAVSIPDNDIEEFDHEDQYSVAAVAGAFLFLLGIGYLYLQHAQSI